MADVRLYLRGVICLCIVLLVAVSHQGARALIAVVLTAAALILGMVLEATSTNRKDQHADAP